MSTLFIGDPHEKIDRLKALIAEHGPKAKNIVCVGDYFDSWDGYGPNTEATLQWLIENIDDPKYKFILGNHDLQYAAGVDNAGFICSGYNGLTKNLCSTKVDWEFWSKFHLWVESDGYIASHAGFNETTYWVKNVETWRMALQTGNSHHLAFAVGEDSGGHSKNPGPFWLRWDKLEGVESLHQIVGHTELDGIQFKQTGENSSAFNIDCGLREVLLVHRFGEWEILD